MNSAEPTHFADRLTAAIQRVKTPVLVGLDPRVGQLPPALQTASDASLEEVAANYTTFCREIIDVVAPLVAVVKPQAAFFEQLGPAGMFALGEVVSYAHKQGLMVILDGKRNDIGSTATAYAQGFLGAGDASPWGADSLTVSPYLGDDSLKPFVDVANERGAGIFVLVKTSNPGGGMLQDLVADGEPLYRHVAKYVEQLATETAGQCGYGTVGAVVGATYPEQLSELRQFMPHTFLLVPGFGSQGAGAKDVAGGFDANGLGAVINSSRAIIFAYEREEYRDRFDASNWLGAVEQATRDMIAQLSADTPAGNL